MRSLRMSVGFALAALVLAAVGCAKKPLPPPPPRDTDGTPPEAGLLHFDQLHVDSADRKRGDLDDWYRLEVPEAGTVLLELSAPQQQGSLSQLFLVLTDAGGVARVDPMRTGGRARVELTREVAPGTHLVWVGTEPEATASVAYQIEARFLPKPPPPKRVVRKPPQPKPVVVAPPPPPPPSVETRVTSVVEVERDRDDTQFATIAGGERMGFRTGLRGRFVEAGRTIGTFQIVEVYSGGSRVKIQGRLTGPVSGRTVVEVDVPTQP